MLAGEQMLRLQAWPQQLQAPEERRPNEHLDVLKLPFCDCLHFLEIPWYMR